MAVGVPHPKRGPGRPRKDDPSLVHPIVGIVEKEQAARQHRQPRASAAIIEREIETSLAEKWRSLLTSTGGGSYFKIFRTAPLPSTWNGRLRHVSTVRVPDSVNDLEEHFYSVALEARWESGEFEIQGWADRGTEPVFVFPLSFELPGPARGDGGGSAPGAMAQLREAAGTAKDLMEIAGGNKSDPAALLQASAAVYTAGTQAAKGDQSVVASLLTLLTPIVATLAESLKPSARPAASDGLGSTVEAVKTLRELGVLPVAREEDRERDDLVSFAQRWAQHIEIVRPFVERGSAPVGPTFAAAVIEFLRSPGSGRVLEHAAIGFRNLTAAVGTWAAGRPEIPPAAIPSAVVALPAPAPVVASAPAPSTAPGSLLAPFHRAIIEGDFSVFPRVYEVLRVAGAEPLLLEIRDGTVTWETLPAEATSQLPELTLSGAKPFFDRFTLWLRSVLTVPTVPTAPPTNGGTPLGEEPIGVCERCGAVYHVQDAGTACDVERVEAGGSPVECGGAIRRREGAG